MSGIIFPETLKEKDSSKSEYKQLSVALPTLSIETKTRETQITKIDYTSLTFGDRLGAGSFGEVFHGYWNAKENQVAIKVLTKRTFTTSALKEFKREAAIMAKMDSDYIVQLRGVCESPSYCLVMEYMSQGSLYDLLHNGQTIPWAIRLQISLDVTHGLAQLHEVAILHRDLKSMNILLNDRLRAKLADFGISKIKTETRTLSSEQASVGTLAWMAPETVSLRPKYSVQSDMYSYGMVLWELAAREIPFKQIHPFVLISKLEKGEATESIPEEVKRERPVFSQLIQHCWQSVGKRPSAMEAAQTLEKLYTTEVELKHSAAEAMCQLPRLSNKESGSDKVLSSTLLPTLRKFMLEDKRQKKSDSDDERFGGSSLRNNACLIS